MQREAQRLCEFSQLCYQRKLVSGMEGNLSVRLPTGHILCTPTMLCKGAVQADDLCVTQPDGTRVSGGRPSSELPMHLAIYREDSRINAVVHAHPPHATAFALLSEPVPTEFLPEAAVFFGDIPLVPYATTGTPAMGEALRPFVQGRCAALLQNHGAVTWAESLELAFAYMDSLEAICKVLHLARQIGTPRPIPPDKLSELHALRAKQKARAD